MPTRRSSRRSSRRRFAPVRPACVPNRSTAVACVRSRSGAGSVDPAAATATVPAPPELDDDAGRPRAVRSSRCGARPARPAVRRWRSRSPTSCRGWAAAACSSTPMSTAVWSARFWGCSTSRPVSRRCAGRRRTSRLDAADAGRGLLAGALVLSGSDRHPAGRAVAGAAPERDRVGPVGRPRRSPTSSWSTVASVSSPTRN